MADRVDATMQSMKAPQAQSNVDRVFSEPQRNQLPTRNDSVLPSSKLSNCRIRTASLQFPAYMTGKCRLGRHAPTVTPPTSRVVRGASRMCDVLRTRSALHCGLGGGRLGLADRGALQGVGESADIGAG